MKYSLMLQSLSPLAVLTIIRNFSFANSKEIYPCYLACFIKENSVLIIVLMFCVVWIVAAVLSFISFMAFKWSDKKSGYQISHIEEKEDASLNFFMTMIIPLLIDDVGTIQGALTFAIIVVIMFALLGRINLFYANPVLAILGYRIYEYTFVSNDDFPSDRCIGLVRGKIRKESTTIEYKIISEQVTYVKEM